MGGADSDLHHNDVSTIPRCGTPTNWNMNTLVPNIASSASVFSQFSLDPNTAAANLLLSENNRCATLLREEQPGPERPERTSSWTQVLCREGVTGRSYWEVKWNGRVNIGVAYGGMRKSGEEREGCLGWSTRSWNLHCSAQGYAACHNSTVTSITQASPSGCGRVGVYTDWSSGTVSFYCLPSLESRTQVHLHTFHSTFTGPLYPAFGLEQKSDSRLLKSSVHLLQIED